MEEIELSVMSYDSAVSDLQTVLQEFEAQHRARERVQQWSVCSKPNWFHWRSA